MCQLHSAFNSDSESIHYILLPSCTHIYIIFDDAAAGRRKESLSIQRLSYLFIIRDERWREEGSHFPFVNVFFKQLPKVPPAIMKVYTRAELG